MLINKKSAQRYMHQIGAISFVYARYSAHKSDKVKDKEYQRLCYAYKSLLKNLQRGLAELQGGKVKLPFVVAPLNMSYTELIQRTVYSKNKNYIKQ